MSFTLFLSAPSLCATPRGPRLVHTAHPTADFWTAWRNGKSALIEQGYSVRKDENGWRVLKYVVDQNHPLPPEIAPVTLRNTQILYPHQVRAAGHLCASIMTHGAALDRSHTGTGKTITAFGVVREFQREFGIICPKSVIQAWERWAATFRMRPLFITNYEQVKSKNFRFGYFDKWGNFIWKLNPVNTILIFDEAHRCKGEHTDNARVLMGAKASKVPLLLLSATIATQPREMRASGYALGLHDLDGFSAWSKSYGCYQNKFNGWECANAVEQMKKIGAELDARGYCVRISDIPGFPETQITAECYECDETEKQNKHYENLLQEIEKLKVEKKAGYTAAILTLNLRYRQFSEFRKISVLCELAKDFVSQQMSVVIFVNFTETLLELQKKLKAGVVHGQQTGDERQKAVDDFQAGNTRVIVCNVQAGGVGLSLHDTNGVFPRVSLLCPTYGAIALKQALGRVHRSGGTTSLQRLVYAKGTIEEQICKSVAKKLDNIAALNDGDLMEPDVFKLLGGTT